VSAVSELREAAVSCAHARDLAACEPHVWHARGLGDFWQHVLVAEGSLDAAVDAHLSLWDYPTPALIVAEAGGRASALDGASPRPGEQVVTSNGLLHDELLGLLRH
jgi:histidinol-phosphatase